MYTFVHYTLWPNVCGPLIITPLYGSSLNRSHKVGNKQLYRKSSYAVSVQFPFTFHRRSKPVQAWQCPWALVWISLWVWNLGSSSLWFRFLSTQWKIPFNQKCITTNHMKMFTLLISQLYLGWGWITAPLQTNHSRVCLELDQDRLLSGATV